MRSSYALSLNASRIINSSCWSSQCMSVPNVTFGAVFGGDSQEEEKKQKVASAPLGEVLQRFKLTSGAQLGSPSAFNQPLGLRALSTLPRAGLGSRSPLATLSAMSASAAAGLPSAQGAAQRRDIWQHTYALTGMDSHNLSLFLMYGWILMAGTIALASIGYVIAPRKIDLNKGLMYECGFDAFGDSRQQFDISFYKVAALFILFDLELTLVIPYIFACTDWWSWGVMMYFFGILTWGFVYEWQIGALEWK